MIAQALSKRGFSQLRSGVSWLAGAKSGASAVAQTLLTQTSILGISLCTGVVSARALGAAGRGNLAGIVLWPQVFAGLFAFGVPAALVYHARRAPQEERSLFGSALLLSIVASVVMVVAGFLSIPHALHSYGPSIIRYAQLYVFVAPQVLISYILVAHLQVRGGFRDFNVFRFGQAASTLVALLVFASLKSLTPPIAAACYLLPPIPFFLVVLIRAFRSLPPPDKSRDLTIGAATRKISHYATRALGIDLLGTLSSQVDQLMVVSFLDPASMGAYVVALSVSRVPNVVVGAMSSVMSPRAASLDPVPLTEFVGRCTRVASALMVAAGLALGAILPAVLPRLFGHDFTRSIASARILLIELVLTGAATLLAEAFKGVGRPGIVTILQAISLSASVLLLLLFVPRFGLVGASLALLSAAVIRLTALLMLYRKTVGVAPPQLLVSLDDVRFVRSMLASQLSARSA